MANNVKNARALNIMSYFRSRVSIIEVSMDYCNMHLAIVVVENIRSSLFLAFNKKSAM